MEAVETLTETTAVGVCPWRVFRSETWHVLAHYTATLLRKVPVRACERTHPMARLPSVTAKVYYRTSACRHELLRSVGPRCPGMAAARGPHQTQRRARAKTMYVCEARPRRLTRSRAPHQESVVSRCPPPAMPDAKCILDSVSKALKMRENCGGLPACGAAGRWANT